MKKTSLFLIGLILTFGCSMTDPKIGTRMEGGIDYYQWVKGQPWLNFDLINLRVDDVQTYDTHDTLTFSVIKKEAPAKYGSFNSNFDQYGTELKLNLYLLDENRMCFDKVHKFKRISRFPGVVKVDIPKDPKLKYFTPYYGLKWYFQH